MNSIEFDEIMYESELKWKIVLNLLSSEFLRISAVFFSITSSLLYDFHALCFNFKDCEMKKKLENITIRSLQEI